MACQPPDEICFSEVGTRRVPGGRRYIAQTSEQNSHLFIKRVESAISYILKHPDSNIRGWHGTLRRKIHRQSHWVVYRRLPTDPDTLEIIAIAHERRGEEYWEERFEPL